MRSFNFAILCLSLCLANTGCVQTGQPRGSLWPTNVFSGSQTNKVPDAMTSITDTSRGVKGQLATVGSAFSSAYEKTRSAVSTALSPTSDLAASDPISLSNRPASIGPELHVATGQLYESKLQFTKALDSYSKALEIESTNVPALTATARLYDRQGQFTQAVEFYTKAIDSAGSDGDLLVEMGSCYARAGKLSQAQTQLQTAINLNPTSKEYRQAMASVLIDQGQTTEALNEIAQVEAPAMANYRMAYLMFNRQKIAEAKRHLAKALEIDPNLGPARDLMAQMNVPMLANQASEIYQSGKQFSSSVNQLMSTNNTTSSSLQQLPSTRSSTSANTPQYSSGESSLNTANAFPVPTIR